jgi:glucosamine-6-phosphate deaminase
MIIEIAHGNSGVAERVADLVASSLDSGGQVLGVATGSTMQPLYQELAHRHRNHRLPPIRHLVLADEYLGLRPDDPRSYRHEILHSVAIPLGIPPERILAPSVDRAGGDAEQACGCFEAAIAALGGVDLQLLGIGHNAHIAFNEPGTDFAAATHVVELSASTRQANARFFSSLEEVPARAVTQGIATILKARRVVAVATGSAKSEAVHAMVTGPIGPAIPATALRLHEGATVVLDDAAAGRLPLSTSGVRHLAI